MNLLSRKELEKLTTKRLLAYKKRLLQCHETQDWDRGSRDVAKSEDRWKRTYTDVKEILTTREHVERKADK